MVLLRIIYGETSCVKYDFVKDLMVHEGVCKMFKANAKRSTNLRQFANVCDNLRKCVASVPEWTVLCRTACKRRI